ncbi:hypothetical protein IJF89_01510 [Candidatus Saccharibacteria bacterium]|nr:hypothetical protein [Candidatus Saccharibacteria bacterium]
MVNESTSMKKNFEYYIEHQDEFVKKYNGKFIILTDCKFFGAYNSLRDAIIAADGHLKSGKYIIQQVGEGEENYTKIISRVGVYA